LGFLELVLEGNVPGCFVECGVWKGGSSAIMALAIRNARQERHLHLFDSFEGLPEPTEKDGEYAAVYSGGHNQGKLATINQCQAGLDEVRNLMLNKSRRIRTLCIFMLGGFRTPFLPQPISLDPSHCCVWMGTGMIPQKFACSISIPIYLPAESLSWMTTFVGRDAGKQRMSIAVRIRSHVQFVVLIRMLVFGRRHDAKAFIAYSGRCATSVQPSVWMSCFKCRSHQRKNRLMSQLTGRAAMGCVCWMACPMNA